MGAARGRPAVQNSTANPRLQSQSKPRRFEADSSQPPAHDMLAGANRAAQCYKIGLSLAVHKRLHGRYRTAALFEVILLPLMTPSKGNETRHP